MFSHLTLQEFLCAFFFVEIKRRLPEKEETSDVTWMFVAGLLSRIKDEKLMKNLLETLPQEDTYDGRNRVLRLQCLYEYGDDKLSKPSADSTSDQEKDPSSRAQESSFEKTFKDSDFFCQSFTIGVQEGIYELSQLGILLEWPTNAVTCPTQIEFREISPPFCPAPAKDNETLVSYIVKLGPSNVELKGLITISLIHSGASRKDGYETIVKTFDGESCNEWKEVLTEKSRAQGCSETDHAVQVKINKLSSLAVVSRLVKDQFEVTEKGCVVRSSVCNDVTVEFPEGAVDKTVNGSMKLQLMPDKVDIDGVAYPGPAILLDGFEDVKFNVPVIITLPHPHSMDYCSGEVRVFLLEDGNPNSDNWKDISGQIVHVEKTSHIQLHVDQFCWVWVWIYEVPLSRVTSLFKYLFLKPQAVYFAVFKEACECDFDQLKMTLVCVANHKQKEVAAEMKDEGYTQLTSSTSDKLMRPLDKAYTKVEGCYSNMIEEAFFLQFLENQVCRKDLTLREEEDQEEGNIQEDEQVARGSRIVIPVLVLSFLENLEEEEEHICKFIINKAKILHRESKKESTPPGPSVNATLGLGDDQKRWLVVSICLNKILAPTLRHFLEPKMLCLYTNLKTKKNIDKQVHGAQLTKDGKCNSLNYGSINDNVANHKKKIDYDYKVNSDVDLAKLYLQPFMAKFSGFDDSCDLSAALNILSSASAFSTCVQDLSKQVKNDIRNEWGHCNFSVWDETKFNDCFKLMKDLLKALNLNSEDEKKTTEELEEWKTKGMQLCIGSIADADLLKFIELSNAELERLDREVKDLQNRDQNEADRLNNALKVIRSNLERFEDYVYNKLEYISQTLEDHGREIQALKSAQHKDSSY